MQLTASGSGLRTVWRAEQQHRQRGSPDHALCHAAQDEMRQAVPPVRTHHDQVGAPSRRFGQDLGRRVVHVEALLPSTAVRIRAYMGSPPSTSTSTGAGPCPSLPGGSIVVRVRCRGSGPPCAAEALATHLGGSLTERQPREISAGPATTSAGAGARRRFRVPNRRVLEDGAEWTPPWGRLEGYPSSCTDTVHGEMPLVLILTPLLFGLSFLSGMLGLGVACSCRP